RVPLAFVMTYTSNLESTIDLQRNASSPFFGLVCHKFSLGPLEASDAEDLASVLLAPLAVVDAPQKAKVVGTVVQSSHGWPYLVQRLCQDYMNTAIDDQGAYTFAAS